MAVHGLTYDWMERWDGDVDFGTAWCVIDVDEPVEWVDDPAYGGGFPPIVIPSGVYLIQENEQGFIYVTRWDSETDMSLADYLLDLDDGYSKWLDSEDDF